MELTEAERSMLDTAHSIDKVANLCQSEPLEIATAEGELSFSYQPQLCRGQYKFLEEMVPGLKVEQDGASLGIVAHNVHFDDDHCLQGSILYSLHGQLLTNTAGVSQFCPDGILDRRFKASLQLTAYALAIINERLSLE